MTPRELVAGRLVASAVAQLWPYTATLPYSDIGTHQIPCYPIAGVISWIFERIKLLKKHIQWLKLNKGFEKNQ